MVRVGAGDGIDTSCEERNLLDVRAAQVLAHRQAPSRRRPANDLTKSSIVVPELMCAAGCHTRTDRSGADLIAGLRVGRELVQPTGLSYAELVTRRKEWDP